MHGVGGKSVDSFRGLTVKIKKTRLCSPYPFRGYKMGLFQKCI